MICAGSTALYSISSNVKFATVRRFQPVAKTQAEGPPPVGSPRLPFRNRALLTALRPLTEQGWHYSREDNPPWRHRRHFNSVSPDQDTTTVYTLFPWVYWDQLDANGLVLFYCTFFTLHVSDVIHIHPQERHIMHMQLDTGKCTCELTRSTPCLASN